MEWSGGENFGACMLMCSRGSMGGVVGGGCTDEFLGLGFFDGGMRGPFIFFGLGVAAFIVVGWVSEWVLFMGIVCVDWR